ncbi:MAG: chorismate lyase [Pseudohongiellaceae bacterium]
MNIPAYRLLRADSALRWGTHGSALQTPRPALAGWLLDSGSLTRHLQKLSQGAFDVRVLAEGWQRCHLPSLPASLVSAGRSRVMWSRQVVLYGCGEPWVVAHTLIPVTSLRGSLRQLKALNETPLGAFLFRQRQIRRGGMETALSGEGIWGRRSIFFRENRPLLVAEFFLPELINRLEHDPPRRGN